MNDIKWLGHSPARQSKWKMPLFFFHFYLYSAVLVKATNKFYSFDPHTGGALFRIPHHLTLELMCFVVSIITTFTIKWFLTWIKFFQVNLVICRNSLLQNIYWLSEMTLKLASRLYLMLLILTAFWIRLFYLFILSIFNILLFKDFYPCWWTSARQKSLKPNNSKWSQNRYLGPIASKMAWQRSHSHPVVFYTV